MQEINVHLTFQDKSVHKRNIHWIMSIEKTKPNYCTLKKNVNCINWERCLRKVVCEPTHHTFMLIMSRIFNGENYLYLSKKNYL